ncbi:hypothetical protein VTL71DRAFT_70 [Oculimacula yallundae]|uniref:2EXR domain-containing protein n=1 Tax=Oculimacula yallundae TaxID=86028 RepID=A0ABR4D0I7_9HELO
MSASSPSRSSSTPPVPEKKSTSEPNATAESDTGAAQTSPTSPKSSSSEMSQDSPTAKDIERTEDGPDVSSSAAAGDAHAIQATPSSQKSSNELSQNSSSTEEIDRGDEPRQSHSSGGRGSFTLFPKLPMELRVSVWKITLGDARVVCVNCPLKPVKCPRPKNVEYKDKEDYGFYFESSTQPPSILHVDHESREEGLRIYRSIQLDDTYHAKIYINPQLDTLYCMDLEAWGNYGTEFLAEEAPKDVTKKLRYIMLELKNVPIDEVTMRDSSTEGPEPSFLDLNDHFPAVEIFMFAVRHQKLFEPDGSTELVEADPNSDLKDLQTPQFIYDEMLVMFDEIKQQKPDFKVPKIRIMELKKMAATRSAIAPTPNSASLSAAVESKDASMGSVSMHDTPDKMSSQDQNRTITDRDSTEKSPDSAHGAEGSGPETGSPLAGKGKGNVTSQAEAGSGETIFDDDLPGTTDSDHLFEKDVGASGLEDMIPDDS